MKLPEPRQARKLRPKSGSHFPIHEPKLVEEETARRFWQEYDAGPRIRKKILDSDLWERRVLQFSASQAGTVREFANPAAFEDGLRAAVELPKKIMELKPERFELQPIEILSVDRSRLRYVERVYPAPPAYEIIYGTVEGRSRYLSFFEKKMARKGISWPQARSAVLSAFQELARMQVHPDPTPRNVLVLDIDKNTGLALLAIVDYTGSKQT
jgi:hypothetical protein